MQERLYFQYWEPTVGVHGEDISVLEVDRRGSIAEEKQKEVESLGVVCKVAVSK